MTKTRNFVLCASLVLQVPKKRRVPRRNQESKFETPRNR